MGVIMTVSERLFSGSGNPRAANSRPRRKTGVITRYSPAESGTTLAFGRGDADAAGGHPVRDPDPAPDAGLDDDGGADAGARHRYQHRGRPLRRRASLAADAGR